MNSIPKLIRRFVGIWLISSFLLIVLNFGISVFIAMKQSPNGTPWKTAEQAAAALQRTEKGYALSGLVSAELKSHHVWAIFIEDATHQVVWHTDNLPDSVPLEFSVSDVADLTRGYIDGYPTFTGKSEQGLMVLGYPKDSFWKHMWPSWDYQFIANLPKMIFFLLSVNVALIFLIYMIANSKLLKSVRPIADGIQALPTGKPVVIRERGLLSELSANINRTSQVLQSQNVQLRKKETARADWIAGVSHDIRTPLSMVMGYAEQLKSDASLPDSVQKKALVIYQQSQRMSNLIRDLNLASKLEYNMQPRKQKRENVVALVRQVAVDFMNTDIEKKYPMEWETEDTLSSCFVNADRDLLKRAVSNLIQNCINHNENGCTVYVSVQSTEKSCIICVEDDGTGISEAERKALNTAPNYMVCDTNTTERRHGLGLQIVRQIAASHGGQTLVEHSPHGGLSVKIFLPRLQEVPVSSQ